MVDQTVVVTLERAMRTIQVEGRKEVATRGQGVVGRQAAPLLEVEDQAIWVRNTANTAWMSLA